MLGSEQTNFASNSPVPRAEAIARLNDQLRCTARGGQIMVTRGVSSLEGFDAAELMAALSSYDGFDPDNDPHGERDFGDLTLWGEDLLWKVDAYDRVHQFASPDPADERVTSRVLTVMLATEY
ncbi:MAG: DUF3768 domain-containing protein [Sphingomicrobium sp.]|nr:DUF3768 domain-containing protein [Sphingomonadales bacterium]